MQHAAMLLGAPLCHVFLVTIEVAAVVTRGTGGEIDCGRCIAVQCCSNCWLAQCQQMSMCQRLPGADATALSKSFQPQPVAVERRL